MSLYLDIEKKLGSFHLKVKLEAANETLALFGASGCGKSMTLRCIAGLDTPDRGKIVVDGLTLFDSEQKVDLSPQQRRTGLLFQNYALFPHMTVLQNITAGARREKDKARRRFLTDSVMESFGLGSLGKRLPHELSGGQQQRVALARILVSSPDILLLDEPFSALDSHLRFQLEQEVRQVIQKFGKTVLLVSHDRDEVFRMSDSIAVMDNGNIQQIGTKHEVFSVPETVEAARLTGCENISPVRVEGTNRLFAHAWGIPLSTPLLPSDISAIGIRAHEIREGDGENSFHCHVVEEIEKPFTYALLLRPESASSPSPLIWEVDKAHWQKKRSRQITIHLPPNAILLLNGQREKE